MTDVIIIVIVYIYASTLIWYCNWNNHNNINFAKHHIGLLVPPDWFCEQDKRE